MSRKREADAPRRYDPDGRPVTSIVTATERISHGKVFGRTSKMFYGRRHDAPLDAKFIPALDQGVRRPDAPKHHSDRLHRWSVRGATVIRENTAEPRVPVVIVRPIVTDGSISPRTLEALTESWVANNPADISGEYIPPVGCGWNYSEE